MLRVPLICLLLASCLLPIAGCGGGGTANAGGPTPTPTPTVVPGFTNHDLTGTYIFNAVSRYSSSFLPIVLPTGGLVSAGYTFEAGVFNADGNGNISNGIMDFNDSVRG